MAKRAPPPQIAALLHTACYDCHSSETRWPWYLHVTPISWLIADDVKEVRENLNLSDWPNDNPVRAAKRLENMSDEVGSGEMPLPKYTKIHADARLTESQRKQLTDRLDAEAARLKSMTGNNFMIVAIKRFHASGAGNLSADFALHRMNLVTDGGGSEFSRLCR